MKEYYNMNLLSQNRSSIYGIAALLIVLFHSIFPSDFNSIFLSIINTGNIGVDIFLFLSGISLYYSITGKTLKQFYIKRMQRVITPTLLVGIPYFILVDIFLLKKGIKEYFYDLFGINFFTRGVRQIWFIILILIMYLLYPFLHKLFRLTKWSILTPIVCIAIVICANILFKYLNEELFEHYEILLRRIPIFIFGSYCGKNVKEKKQLRIKKTVIIFVALAAFVVSIVIANKCKIVAARYTYAICAVPISMLLSMIKRPYFLCKILTFFSNITLEIYLIYEKIIFLIVFFLGSKHYIIFGFFAFMASIAGSLLLKRIENLLLNLKKQNNPNT